MHEPTVACATEYVSLLAKYTWLILAGLCGVKCKANSLNRMDKSMSEITQKIPLIVLVETTALEKRCFACNMIN